MCDKAIKTDPKLLRVFPNYFNTPELCESTAKNLFFARKNVSNSYRTLQMVVKIIFKNPLLLVSTKFNISVKKLFIITLAHQNMLPVANCIKVQKCVFFCSL